MPPRPNTLTRCRQHRTMRHTPTSATHVPQCLWDELHNATTERGHAWRTPVLATLGLEGAPQARTVVLRAADAARGELRVFTDRRSPKVAELAAQPVATLVFWSEALQWQLRASVTVTVVLEGPEVDATWARVARSASAGDYLTPTPPGHALEPSATEAGLAPGDHRLALLVMQVRCLDWLALARTGHRRARIEGGALTWLVP